jgi:hypothetical protein
MNGTMVMTTPPAQTGIDGFAAVPSGTNQVSIVAGNCDGSCAVTVNGLHLGTTVSVKVEQTVSLGRTVASSGPSTVSTTTYTPTNGTITVPITMATNNAYRITITPGSGGGSSTPPPTTTPPTTTPAGSCNATVSLNSWSGGYVATVKVSAGAAAVNGWAVGMTLPAGGAMTNAWNAASAGTTGAVTFHNVSYNGQIAAGGSTEFGFQGTGAAPTATPTCQAQ